jgi:DNA-directed RNA polymerase specialized sigma subunit
MSILTDDISQYLHDIHSIPRMSSTELLEHIDLYKLTKSIHLRDILIEYYLLLILQIVLRYTGQGIDLSDLIQEANIKLIHVIETLVYTDILDIPAFIVRSVNNHIIDKLRHISQ